MTTSLHSTAGADATAHWPQPSLSTLVDRARCLHDRTAVADAAAALLRDGELLARWARSVTGDDADAFQRRLRWDGIDGSVLTPAMSAPAGDAAPPWLDVVCGAWRAAAASPERPATAGALAAGIIDPFVSVALARLQLTLGRWARLLSAAALDDLRTALVERLCQLVDPVLTADLGGRRAVMQSMGRLVAETALAEQVHAAWSGRALEARCHEYPVLARLLGTACRQWVTVIDELVRRFRADASAIAALTGLTSPPTQISGIELDLGDPHEDGRTVLVVRVGSGQRCVYKPRSGALDVAYAALLDVLHQHGDMPRLRSPRLVDRGTYAWYEFIEAAPCRSRAAVERYYERCGALLAVMHALRGTDVHQENVIAAGEEPVLIDLETLLAPRITPDEVRDGRMTQHVAVRDRLADSVLHTRMLPTVQPGAHGSYAIIGAMRDDFAVPTAGDGTPSTPLRWPSAPTLGGELQGVGRHVAAVCRGFRAAYRCLMRSAATLLAPGGALDALATAPVRVVLRNTATYHTLLLRATAPHRLRNGVERSIELDRIARAFLSAPVRPALWPVLRAEHLALERLDVPVFRVRADATSLTLETGVVIHNAFSESAVQRARSRIASLSDTDARIQQRLIRAAIAAHVRTGFDDAASSAAPRPMAVAEAGPMLERQWVRQLQDAALYDEDGCPAWIGECLAASAGRWWIGSMGAAAGDGLLAQAHLLGQCAAPSRRTDAMRRALIVSARSELTGLLRALRMRREVDGGLATGLGGWCALLHDSSLTGSDVTAMRDAIAAELGPSTVARISALGLFDGLAGFVVGLVRRGDAWELLDRAVRALLERRGPVERRPPSGLSLAYGDAGIALALCMAGHHAARPEWTAVGSELLSRLATRCELPASYEPTAALAAGMSGVLLAAVAEMRATGQTQLGPAGALALVCVEHHAHDGGWTLGGGRAGRAFALSTASRALQSAGLAVTASRVLASAVSDAASALRHVRAQRGDSIRGTLMGPAGVLWAAAAASDTIVAPLWLTIRD